jgi:crotonobetainyl-CoA:carnitine CoA-transferase CaiB-like acyl-CoA transferase
MTAISGPLAGLRILDLTRVLAGPAATQLLADLGADVIKVERPGSGDDTRGWGPPYLKDTAGGDTSESAYYLSANRNKRSVAIDFTQPEGRRIVRQLALRSDVLIENFKVGQMKRWALAYADLKDDLPELIYCSISGFGQTGPYAPRAGYDFLVQGIGGVMSITGEPDGPPIKVGVAVADIVCGLYAATAILAAIRHRDASGTGQYIDLGLLDTQVAWLMNQGMNFLTSGRAPGRLGNAHPNIVPYQAFQASNGHIILAIGNDTQFARFCDFAGVPELSRDALFATNRERVRNRERLVPTIERIVGEHTAEYWLEGLEAINVPCGPVNNLDQVFADPQVKHRGMEIVMDHPLAGDNALHLIGNPIKFSTTPVAYHRPPPLLGEHTDEVLGELLGLDGADLEHLRAKKVI